MSNPTIEQLDELRDSCEGKGPGCFSRPFSHTKEPVLSASPQTTGNIPVVELTLYIVGFSIMFDSMYINVRRTNGLDFEAGADRGSSPSLQQRGALKQQLGPARPNQRAVNFSSPCNPDMQKEATVTKKTKLLTI